LKEMTGSEQTPLGQGLMIRRERMLGGARSMPFERYGAKAEQIETMRSAFRMICDALRLNCDADDPVTDVIVLKIMEIAKTGEHDPVRISDRVLSDINAQAVDAARE
jgi:hypothetical protein